MATTITPRRSGTLHYLNPLLLLGTLWQHRALLRQFTRRDIEGRYKGSYLGVVWSFINPLLMLLIYTFVFGVVFNARWPQSATDSLGGFAVVLFSGLLVFNIFGECLSRAPGLVVGVPNYVKKVIFPLEILPVAALGAALFHALVSLSILLCANLLINGVLQATVLLLPLVLLPLLMFALGLGWLLASLGVFVRDISYTIGLVVQALFFLTPIFYPLASVPPAFRFVLGLNPLAAVVENSRRVLLWGLMPDWGALLGWTLAAAFVMLLGYAFFMHTKHAFADVL